MPWIVTSAHCTRPCDVGCRVSAVLPLTTRCRVPGLRNTPKKFRRGERVVNVERQTVVAVAVGGEIDALDAGDAKVDEKREGNCDAVAVDAQRVLSAATIEPVGGGAAAEATRRDAIEIAAASDAAISKRMNQSRNSRHHWPFIARWSAHTGQSAFKSRSLGHQALSDVPSTNAYLFFLSRR